MIKFSQLTTNPVTFAAKLKLKLLSLLHHRAAIERDSNIAFGQLLSFANEMVQFKLSFSTVSQFTITMCIANKLDEDKRKVLFVSSSFVFLYNSVSQTVINMASFALCIRIIYVTCISRNKPTKTDQSDWILA